MFMLKTWQIGCAAALGVAALGASQAQAASVTYNFNTVRTGGTPAGAAPWLSLSFDDGGTAGSVDVLFSATNLPGSEFVSQLQFNLDPSLDPGDLTGIGSPTQTGSFEFPTGGASSNAYNGIHGESFDIELDFAHTGRNHGSHRFTDGDTLGFTLGGISTLTANSFNFLSEGASHDPAYNMAHIQSIANANPDSSKVTGAPRSPSVPTPTAAAMAAVGLGLLKLRRRRRDA